MLGGGALLRGKDNGSSFLTEKGILHVAENLDLHALQGRGFAAHVYARYRGEGAAAGFDGTIVLIEELDAQGRCHASASVAGGAAPDPHDEVFRA